jgi:hypothetical protein
MSNRYLKQLEETEHEKIPVKLLGIRGFDEDLGKPHKNELGIYDDLIVRCIGDETIGFRASRIFKSSLKPTCKVLPRNFRKAFPMFNPHYS